MRVKNKEKQTNKIHRVGGVAPEWTVCLTCERTHTSALKGRGFIYICSIWNYHLCNACLAESRTSPPETVVTMCILTLSRHYILLH